MNKLGVKGVIFDYGGTLDTRGDHWSEVLWKGYEHFGLGVGTDEEMEFGVSIDKQSFRDAYVYAERALAVNPIVTPSFHFVDILREKLKLELSFLAGLALLSTGKDDVEKQAQLKCRLALTEVEIVDVAKDMAEYIDHETRCLLEENKLVLEHLKQAGFPMVLVSNFYGNIETVLKDAQLDGYFEQIVESAVVGVRKPNPAIFALGVCALDLPASQVLVVGDTYTKDIMPAHQLGCRTLWIKGLQWEDKLYDESVPDGIITKLSDMEAYLGVQNEG